MASSENHHHRPHLLRRRRTGWLAYCPFSPFPPPPLSPLLSRFLAVSFPFQYLDILLTILAPLRLLPPYHRLLAPVSPLLLFFVCQ